MTTYTRTIKTNLDNDKKASEIIASVVGQLSDGIWENSSKCQGYWVFAECNSRESDINVSESYCDSYYKCSNPYRRMSDNDIIKYFANKLKQIVHIELRDNYEREIEQRFLGDLYRCGIPKDRYDEYNIKYKNAMSYIKDHPYNFKGQFNENNNTQIIYLSYDEDMTVADVYKVYKKLLTNIK